MARSQYYGATFDAEKIPRGDAGPDPIQPLPALVISRMVEMRKEKLVATMLLSDTCIQRKGLESTEVMRIIHPNNPPCRCSEVRHAQR